jgi:hypothetical protein
MKMAVIPKFRKNLEMLKELTKEGQNPNLKRSLKGFYYNLIAVCNRSEQGNILEAIGTTVLDLLLPQDDSDIWLQLQLMRMFSCIYSLAVKPPEIAEIQIFNFSFRRCEELFDKDSHFIFKHRMLSLFVNEDFYRPNRVSLIQTKVEDILLQLTERVPAHRTFNQLCNIKTMQILTYIFSSFSLCQGIEPLDNFLRN